ncbi:MAG: hypothetical protein IKQ23_05675 [Treponema sp.]|nr:hypothetical protein [Treponema sp.]
MEERHYEQHAETIVLTEDGMQITAFWSRLLSGCGTDGKFDPVFVMENIIPLFDNTFNYRVVDSVEWLLPSCTPAYYVPATNEIIVRSDVYEGALAGTALDVIIVTHEVVHCILSLAKRFLTALDFVDFKTELCMADSNEMARNELQTDRITSLVLFPERLVQGKSDEEIIQKYFLNPMIQFVCSLIKMAGKKLLKSLDETEHAKETEVERCAV